MKRSEHLEAEVKTIGTSIQLPHMGISLQTETMITSAGANKYVAVAQHRETKKWHGVLMINHPTPSGCERWLMAFSDSRGFEDPNNAIGQFRNILPMSLKNTRTAP
jgi:hypothetical protein